MHRTGRSIACLAAGLLLAVTLGAPLPSMTVAAFNSGRDRGFGDELDRVVAELERATVQQPDGRHLVMLRALRELRDPKLKPFFTHLTNNGNPLIQINGILGLAELSEPPHVDPFLISRLGDERARYLAIRHALELDLLKVQQMQAMLAWNDLQDAPRIILIAELSERGVEPKVESLEKLAANTDLSISGLAAALLVQVGRVEAFEAYHSRVEALSDAKKMQVKIWACEDLARYNLTKLVDWIEEMLGQEPLDQSLAIAGTGAAIQLIPQRGLALWERMVGPEPSLITRVRFGRLLLEFVDKSPIPRSAFERIRSEDALPRQIAELGVAISTGNNRLAAMLELIDLDHWPTASRAFELAELLPDNERAQLYEHVIKRADQPGPRRDERVELAIRAVMPLLKINADTVKRLLAESPDDELRQEAILLGMLTGDDPVAGAIARTVPRRGFSRADALAMLLIARHESSLNAADLESLRIIGEGGGRLSPAHQAQAAWLYTKHLNRSEQAVARILADS